MAEGKEKRFRLKKHNVDASVGDLGMGLIWTGRAATWGVRRLRPMLHRPVALIGTPGFAVAYWLSPWVTAIVSLSLTLVWPLAHPDSYLKHVAWRGPTFLRGLQLRYRPRRKFTGAKVLSEKEPVIRIDHVQKIGCTTVVRAVMPYGDTVSYWQEKADDLASAFGALEAVVNPYRKPRFTDLRPVGEFKFKVHPHKPHVDFKFKPDMMWRPPFVKLQHTKAKKRVPRQVEIKFLDEDPFAKSVSVDFLDLHRPLDVQASAGPTGVDLDGLPYFENDRMSTLVIALTGGGKSNAERCMVYSDYERVQERLVENWGCDLAYGVELSWMEKQFGRVEYGDDGPEAVREFWHDARVVMQDRLRGMRGETVFFTPAPGDPLLKVYLDECRLLNLPEYREVRWEIYADMSATLTNGRKAGVQVRGFTQTVKLDNFAPRDDFKIIKAGILQRRRHVDMVVGEGAWASGMKSDLLDPDAPGIFFEQTEGHRAPTEMRYGDVPPVVISRLPAAPPGMLGGKKEPTAEQRQVQGKRVFVMGNGH